MNPRQNPESQVQQHSQYPQTEGAPIQSATMPGTQQFGQQGLPHQKGSTKQFQPQAQQFQPQAEQQPQQAQQQPQPQLPQQQVQQPQYQTPQPQQAVLTPQQQVQAPPQQQLPTRFQTQQSPQQPASIRPQQQLQQVPQQPQQVQQPQPNQMAGTDTEFGTAGQQMAATQTETAGQPQQAGNISQPQQAAGQQSSFVGGGGSAGLSQGAQVQMGGSELPPVDILEGDDEFLLLANMPGYDSDEIQLEASGQTLRIVGVRQERKTEGLRPLQRERPDRAERVVQLPSLVDVDKAEATCKNGVCRITLPKASESSNRRIGVQ